MTKTRYGDDRLHTIAQQRNTSAYDVERGEQSQMQEPSSLTHFPGREGGNHGETDCRVLWLPPHVRGGKRVESQSARIGRNPTSSRLQWLLPLDVPVLIDAFT